MERAENIEKGLEKAVGSERSVWQKTKDAARNYVIDTSAKIVGFAPLMAGMEAYNGLDAEQIVGARATSALVDAGVARVYGKARDYARDKTEKLRKKISRGVVKLANCLKEEKLTFGEKRKVYKSVEGVRNYITDTGTMIGVYTPVYGVILALNGASSEKIESALWGGAGIAAVAARPFGKFILEPMRKKFNYVRNS